MKKFYYVLSSFIISIILLLTLQSRVYASGATISASSNSVEKGENVTINANINDASAWSLDISTSGGKLEKTDSRTGTTESGNNESQTIKLGTFSADTAGTYTITLSGYVVDGASLTKSNVSGTVQITVKEPTPVVQEPEPETPTVVEETPNFTDTNKTMYAIKDINLRASWSTSSQATLITKGTELTVTATSSNKVNGYVWYRVSYNGQTKYVASYLLSNTKPEEPVEETPAEEPDEEEPTEDPTTVDEVKEGLESLEIPGLTLTPTFSTDVYEYRIIITEDLNEVTVNAVPALEGATITIAGDKDIQEGENLITIMVYNAKNEVEATYQITVNKNTVDLTEADKILQMGTKEATRNAIIFIAIFATTIVLLIVVVILRSKNKSKNNDGEEQNSEEEADKVVEKENIQNTEKQEQQSTENEQSVENLNAKEDNKEQVDTKSEKRKGKHF